MRAIWAIPVALCAPALLTLTAPSPEPPETTAGDVFPFVLPTEKPDRPLSAAMERLYTAYPAPRPE